MSNGRDLDGNVALAGRIVSAYVTKNPVPAAELPNLIERVHNAVKRVALGQTEEPKQKLVPAVPIKKSITPDYIVCLEDGKRFKSLKRYLDRVHGMTPDEYRAKWGLPADYPMVAPHYSAKRSELAKRIGLGAVRRRSAQTPSPTSDGATPNGQESTKRDSQASVADAAE